MTAAEFKRAGRALYGPRWKRHMAAELGCHRNTVYRLANLDVELPAWAANHAALLAEAKARRLTPQHNPQEDAHD